MSDLERDREPVFNMPAVVTASLVLLALIHAVRMFVLTEQQDVDVILAFSFIPIRYEALAAGVDFPGGPWAEYWTPFTYGLLHGDWLHLAVNGVWLAAFGSALAWRFGALRFLLFTGLATAAGAGAHYLAHSGDMVPVVGASGAISAHMAAVSRFMFQRGGPLASFRRDRGTFLTPALPLLSIFSDRRVLAFLGFWMGLNLLLGLGATPLAGEDAAIAWEAHMGGFLFGLLAFDLMDPVGRAPRDCV